MALAVVQHVTASDSSSSASASITITSSGSGSVLVVGAGTAATHAVTGVTDNKSNTYVQGASTAATSSAGDGSDMWYCLAPVSGVTTVTVTWDTSDTTQKVIEVWEVSGFSSPAYDVSAHVTNGTSSAEGGSFAYHGASVTTTSTTGFVVGVCITRANIKTTPFPGNEFTSGGDSSGSGTISRGFISHISSTAAAHQPVWEDFGSGDAFCSSTLALKEGAGAAIVGSYYYNRHIGAR